MHNASGKPTTEAAVPQDELMWAVSKWNDEVKNRPLINVHRRSLDDTWRQVIRHFGGNPDELVGPSHSDLIAAAPQPQGGCKLGCTDTCKAKEHGCASECPALPWQPQGEVK